MATMYIFIKVVEITFKEDLMPWEFREKRLRNLGEVAYLAEQVELEVVMKIGVVWPGRED